MNDALDIVLACARVALAGVFAVAGAAKLADRPAFRSTIAGFGVPAGAAAALAVTLPALELAAAAALLAAPAARAGAALAVALLAVFSAAILWNLARGRRPDCRCFGQLSASPIGAATLLRNVALAALGLFVAWGGPGALGGVLATTAVVEGLAIVGLLWLVAALMVRNARLLERVAELEKRGTVITVTGGAAQAAGGGASARLGGQAPGFSLPTLAGGAASLDDLRARGRPVLLLFVDPRCGPCGEMLPDVAAWQREHGDRMTIALVSRGKVDANLRKFGGLDAVEVLLQREDEVADAFGVRATPSAVLVRADGRFGAIVERREEIAGLVARVAAEPRALATGDQAPAVSLQDVEGRTVTLDAFLGRRTALLFWSPTCTHCRTLLPRLRDHVAAPPGDAPMPVLVVAGPGAAAATAATAAELSLPLLVDAGGEALRRFGARGTPSAVLLEADGRLGAAVAGGVAPVAALLGMDAVPAGAA
jgi:peroxiredoxin/uncharacterized membrane protein YphA (DoxX/SURF4 family)